jgi:hypothetical protein
VSLSRKKWFYTADFCPNINKPCTLDFLIGVTHKADTFCKKLKVSENGSESILNDRFLQEKEDGITIFPFLQKPVCFFLSRT